MVVAEDDEDAIEAAERSANILSSSTKQKRLELGDEDEDEEEKEATEGGCLAPAGSGALELARRSLRQWAASSPAGGIGGA